MQTGETASVASQMVCDYEACSSWVCRRKGTTSASTLSPLNRLTLAAMVQCGICHEDPLPGGEIAELDCCFHRQANEFSAAEKAATLSFKSQSRL